MWHLPQREVPVYKFQLRTGMLWCLKHGRVTSAGSWCCIQGERRVQRIGCELQIWMKAGSSITLARTQTYSWSWAYGSGFCARSVNEISGASFLQGHLRLNLLQSLRYSAPTKLNDKLKFLKSYLYPASIEPEFSLQPQEALGRCWGQGSVLSPHGAGAESQHLKAGSHVTGVGETAAK